MDYFVGRPPGQGFFGAARRLRLERALRWPTGSFAVSRRISAGTYVFRRLRTMREMVFHLVIVELFLRSFHVVIAGTSQQQEKHHTQAH